MNVTSLEQWILVQELRRKATPVLRMDGTQLVKITPIKVNSGVRQDLLYLLLC